MQDPSLYDARHPWDDVSSIGVPCVASTPRWSTKEQGWPRRSSSSDDARAFEWPPLRDYFIKSMDDSEAERSRTGPSGMPEITWESGKPSLVSRPPLTRNGLSQPGAARGKRVKRLIVDDAFRSPGLLRRDAGCCPPHREAFEAGGANAISANRSSHCEQHDAPQDWSPVAVVGYIRALASNPIRSHAFGFILVESTLVIFLCTHSGLLFSPDIECTEANGYLSTFFARLLSLTDSELGIVASLSAYPFAFAGCLCGCLDIASTWRQSPRSVASRLWNSSAGAPFGMDGARRPIESGRPEAVARRKRPPRRVDQHCRCVPRERVHRCAQVLGGGGGLPRGFRFTPRAMEVAFHEQCFDPIWVIDSTVSLARVILGVAKGLRNLYRMHILHRDVSAGNILVAPDGQGVLIDYDLAIYIKDDGPAPAERYRRAGTLAFLARQRFPPLGGVGPPLPHQPWHDIESLAYNPLVRLEDPGSFPAESKMVLFRSHYGLQKTLQPYTSYWTGVFDLLGIVMHFCGWIIPGVAT
ncbi:BZ3501_MvSof-1269-A2-R1_C52g00281 [Microbotryum saponariae]|nr:BZ3501_MvSof-1269-A2-R1_C52g00281 [Microbotryum saponariae]